MQEHAKSFAARLAARGGTTDEVRVNAAYQILFGREPSGEESSLAQEFLRKPANGDASRWEQYAQLLLASNEMLYVD
jgi:hypothetical protein